MHKLATLWKNNQLTLGIVLIAIIALPLVATLSASRSSIDSTPAPLHSGVRLPLNYRSTYLHYATIERPDGTIRDIYINPEALASSGDYLLPNHTTIVIEGYYAQRDENGEIRLDSTNHYLRGEPFEAVHVREKSSNWSRADFVSEVRSGQWNFGSFEAQTGQPFKESITACFNCHNASSQPDFLFTFPQLYSYAVSNELQFYFCNLTGRSAC